MRRTAVVAMMMAWLPLAAAAEEASVGFGLGIFDTAAWFDDKGDFDAVEGGIVFRGESEGFLGLGPMAGVSATEDSAIWLYLGVRRPFRLASGLSAVPNVAAAYYERGDGKDLGHELEFRTGLELNYRWKSGRSVGLEFYHLSNASISDVNPGSNSLWLVFAVPLGP